MNTVVTKAIPVADVTNIVGKKDRNRLGQLTILG